MFRADDCCEDRLTNSGSRQIRPPIYSIKQNKLRKRRVIRYSILYFALFFLFIALIAGPLVAGPKVNLDPNVAILTELMQPKGYNNNDTVSSQTGTALQAGATGTDSGSSPSSSTDSGSTPTGAKFRVRMA